MKENDVNWIYCAQVNIWHKGDVGWGGGGGQEVDKETYVTRNFLTHFPPGIVRILKL